MSYTLFLLLIIVLSKGYIIINEQFLVALCFVAFVSTVVFYSGDDIKNYLESKERELVADHLEFKQRCLQLMDQVEIIINKRIQLSRELLLIIELFDQIINLVEQSEQVKLLNERTRRIKSELDLLVQSENFAIKALHQKFVDYATFTIQSTSERQYFNDLSDLLIDNENPDQNSLIYYFQNTSKTKASGYKYQDSPFTI